MAVEYSFELYSWTGGPVAPSTGERPGVGSRRPRHSPNEGRTSREIDSSSRTLKSTPS